VEQETKITGLLQFLYARTCSIFVERLNVILNNAWKTSVGMLEVSSNYGSAYLLYILPSFLLSSHFRAPLVVSIGKTDMYKDRYEESIVA
jgi:hypothetical protein